MWNRRIRPLRRARLLVRLQVQALALGSNRCRVNPFQRYAARRLRGRFRRQFLVHRAAEGRVEIAGDLRIGRAVAGLAEIAVGALAGAVVVVVVADAAVAATGAGQAEIAVGVLGANFLLRSMHRRGRLRSIPANRERRKDTFRRCCLESRWRSSGRKALQIFRHRLRRRIRTRLKSMRRRATPQHLMSMNHLRTNRKRMGMCGNRYTKTHRKKCMSPHRRPISRRSAWSTVLRRANRRAGDLSRRGRVFRGVMKDSARRRRAADWNRCRARRSQSGRRIRIFLLSQRRPNRRRPKRKHRNNRTMRRFPTQFVLRHFPR